MKLALGLAAALAVAGGAGCGGGGACTLNADCASQVSQGGHAICRAGHEPGAGQCVELTSDLCATVHGPWDDDDAIILGAVLSTTGADASTGAPIQDAVILAIDEIDGAGGLPPRPGGSARRKLALLGCTDDGDGDKAVTAARHLTEDLGLPAIVGATFSGVTVRVATEVTIPAGALLFSPSATAVNITDLQDDGLVWRTAPSDTYQARALALYIPTIEAAVRATLKLAMTDPVKVAVVHKGDTYGRDLASVLEQQLVLNGQPATALQNQPSYERLDYGDPGGTATNPTQYPQTVQQVIAFAPHILVIVGTTEGVTEILAAVEEGWPAAAAYRPEIVFSDGGEVPELPALVGTDDALRRRVTGTVPGVDTPLHQAFAASFLAHGFEGKGPQLFATAGGYDIAYLIGYSAATLGADRITGAALAGGFRELVPPGAPVDVGPGGFTAGLSLLAKGNIDITGASGSLDFDLDTGEAPSDIQVWCLPKDATGHASSAVPSGLRYDAAGNQVAGMIQGVCD